MGFIFVRLAFRNIWRSKIRTILTLMGIAGNIALFVSLTAISSDLKQQLDQTIERSQIDVIVQEKGAATPVASRVSQETAVALARNKGVRSVASVIVGSIRTKGLAYMFVFGVSDQELYVSVMEWLGAGIIDGTLFQSGKNQILLGRTASRALKKKVGDTLILGAGHEFEVAGIYWLGQGILDGGAILDISESQDLLKREGYVNMILIQGRDKQTTNDLVRELSQSFPSLEITPASSLRGQIRAVTMIDGFVMAVSVIALLISGILILNTLLMAISERTREIGVLAAIGWSRWMIIRLIVTEAMLMGALGGLAGFAAAFPTLQALRLLPAMGPGWIPSVPGLDLFWIAVGLAVGIAGISSLYPAVFATRLFPATALRYE